MPDSPVPPDAIRQQLARIIASSGFGRSDLLARFLRFIVESTLRGEAEKLKEWVIGVEAYSRGPEFDPRVDSIVRTEARRLRRKLADYYASEGRNDPVIIELPTGSYEPLFRFRRDTDEIESSVGHADTIPTHIEGEEAEDLSSATEPPPAQPTVIRSRQRPRWAVPSWISKMLPYAGVVLLTCGGWLIYEKYFARNRDVVHRIALAPVKCTPDNEACRELASAFVNDLGGDLENSGSLYVIEPDALARSSAQGESISQIRSRFKVDHVFQAELERADESWYLTGHIIRAGDQATVSTWGLNCSWSNVAMDEAQVLNGILALAVGKNQRTGRAALLEEKASEDYRLYAKAEGAFGSFNVLREKIYSDYAENQLNRLLRLDPTFNDARILMGKLYVERIWGTHDKATLLAEARSTLERAIELEPKRADAPALLAAVFWELGQRDRGMELAQQALQLGPLDATARSEMAQLYAAMGLFESSVEEANKALALDPTNMRALGFQIVCLSLLGRQSEASEAVRRFSEWYPGALADLFAADQQLRAQNFEEAGRLIASGRERAGAEVRSAFDIADGLRAALMGNRAEGTRVFEQYKNSPPRFWDHLILLGAQIGQAAPTVQLIRESSFYNNYRYLISDRRLSPLRADPVFQALLFESYATWQRDLSRYGSKLPVAPPTLPSPTEFLARK